ncbi:hypothetical protein ACRDNQ_17520 [Palleronia sp. KMU-117]|uniref:hypothetical protein n=1 Tax=Palleronia sp. KMU-117 TaxID=3434108 RepID=UPI003D761404
MADARIVIAGLALVLGLSACAPAQMSSEPLGDFRLGHNIVIADNIQAGPFTRELVEEEIEVAMQTAIQQRLGRFDGDGLYHIGVYVGAGVLALPGVPLVYTPQSNMVIEVNVFDNATRQRLNAEPHRMVIGEGFDKTVPVLGSGLTRARDEQLANISANAARQIEDWLRENETWFTPKPGQVRVPFGDEERTATEDAARSAAETLRAGE